MQPREFLAEECRSVAATLKETLRHDYGPERSLAYFNECRVRLQVVEQALIDDPDMDRQTIAAHMRSLSSLGSRISLIERAHLGEFSWPFAAIVEQVADLLFPEETIDEELKRVLLKPIVHVVAEGTDYQIVDDPLPPPGERHIIIVAFPRQLKHFVLLHTIFGHELAHIAIDATPTGAGMTAALEAAQVGRLAGEAEVNEWIRSDEAPKGVRAALAGDADYHFGQQSLVNWRHELVCDLFGLRLFGPAFAAAHRTIIEALCPRQDFFDLESTTHPPYPIRQRLLANAISVLGWERPVIDDGDGPLHRAESELLAYVSDALDDPWFEVLDREQVKAVLDRIDAVLVPHGLAYEPPSMDELVELVGRLAQERPPIFQSIDDEGVPTNRDVRGSHCLYAGWTYWFGRDRLAEKARATDARVRALSFMELNRLCDQALLQQKAINLVGQPSAKEHEAPPAR